jgi:hypothetical protein
MDRLIFRAIERARGSLDAALDLKLGRAKLRSRRLGASDFLARGRERPWRYLCKPRTWSDQEYCGGKKMRQIAASATRNRLQ